MIPWPPGKGWFFILFFFVIGERFYDFFIKRRPSGYRNRILLAGLRLGALIFFLLPLSGVFQLPVFQEPGAALVLDSSQSMQARFPGLTDEIFNSWLDENRYPVVGARDHPGWYNPQPTAGEKITDLASALSTAAFLLPKSLDRRVLLVSDGITDWEKISEITLVLKQAGVRVFALTPPADPVRQVKVQDVVAPEKVFLWEPFSVKGRVVASSPGAVTVVLRRGEIVIQEKEISVDRFGIAEVEFIQETDKVGSINYSLEIKDRPGSGVTRTIRVAQAPRLLYIGGDFETSQGLVRLFQEAGIDIRFLWSSSFGQTEIDFSRWDVILLDDLPAPVITSYLYEKLRRAVGVDGKGLIVLGGRKGLGSGEYRDAPFELILPVTVGRSVPPPPAAASIVLILDTSFSMYFRGYGQKVFFSDKPRKIDTAIESAKAVVRVLRPQDRLGIIGNSTDLFWLHPLGTISNKQETIGRLDRIYAEGEGINFYSAVHEAYRALGNETSPIRHIMIFCDAEDIDQYEVIGEGHSFDLIRRMTRDGISLSVLAIGQPTDKDVPFLRTSALLGKGDFYLVGNLVSLPRYFVTEYNAIANRLYFEGEIPTSVGDYTNLLYGIESYPPAVNGLDIVTPKKDSRTPIVTTLGVPLVTTGVFGKGKTIVFASDNGFNWANRWLSWPSSKRFWVQLLFSAAPRSKTKRWGYSVVEGDGNLDQAVFHYQSFGRDYPSWERLWINFSGPDEWRGGEKLIRTGLRSYRTESSLPTGFYQAAITSDNAGAGKIADSDFFIPVSNELAPFSEEWDLLDRLVQETGGRWVSSLDQFFENTFRIGLDFRKLCLLSVAFGMVLLLIEVTLKQE